MSAPYSPFGTLDTDSWTLVVLAVLITLICSFMALDEENNRITQIQLDDLNWQAQRALDSTNRGEF